MLLPFLAGFQRYMYAMGTLANTLSLMASHFYIFLEAVSDRATDNAPCTVLIVK
jgi:hypothetical protein